MKKKSKKKSSKSSNRESCSYCIEILDWEMPYYFSISHNKNISVGPFWEFTSLRLMGKILYPEKMANKTIQIDLLGDRGKVVELSNPQKYQYEPKAVGVLKMKKGEEGFLGSLPFDALPVICYLLEVGKAKVLELSGYKLYRLVIKKSLLFG